MNPENGDRVLRYAAHISRWRPAVGTERLGRNAEWSGDASGAKCAPDDDDDQELVLQSGYLIEKLNGGQWVQFCMQEQQGSTNQESSPATPSHPKSQRLTQGPAPHPIRLLIGRNNVRCGKVSFPYSYYRSDRLIGKSCLVSPPFLHLISSHLFLFLLSLVYQFLPPAGVKPPVVKRVSGTGTIGFFP
ncbi:unnamed protein product [Aspergillus oryzae RIB40]|uniref:DNA, SC011 n=2 Tax=Aspergillus oryzae TaxID=5062 RepID=Q2U0H7_ASPOR|nr:unnamed protein product [Aspergillus oryzae RIB40]BAE64938.1 unnamed protein product [Aspergillus oryzae RIB40]